MRNLPKIPTKTTFFRQNPDDEIRISSKTYVILLYFSGTKIQGDEEVSCSSFPIVTILASLTKVKVPHFQLPMFIDTVDSGPAGCLGANLM